MATTQQHAGMTIEFGGRHDRQRAPRIMVKTVWGTYITARWQGLAAVREAMNALEAEGYRGKPRWSQKERCWALPMQQDRSLPLLITVYP